MRYIYHQPTWPKFEWDAAALAEKLTRVRHIQGRMLGKMESLGFSLSQEAQLTTLTNDVLKSSEIEGEILDPEQVRSSIARRLGIDLPGITPTDRNIDGVVEMMLNATQHYDKPLTEERLFGWHASLFPTGWSGMYRITVGDWRKDNAGPMQVVSGAMGQEKVHFEAPESTNIPDQMHSFLIWVNADQTIDPVIKAALAHLWFVTIHPFDDGNGRIARAVADMLLARADGTACRFYSVSTQIRNQRKQYYEILERTQHGTMDVTRWLCWFLDCVEDALLGSEEMLSSVLAKATFWQHHQSTPINDRQRTMINRLFGDFEGKLSSSKWAKITKCSPDTALRDIQQLIEHGILRKDDQSGGRSTHYKLIKLSPLVSNDLNGI